VLCRAVQLNDQAEPVAQEGGRPEEGKHTGDWLVCLAASGEATPSASRSAEAAGIASADQTSRWKAALAGGGTAAVDLAAVEAAAADGAAADPAAAAAAAAGGGGGGGGGARGEKRSLDGSSSSSDARERALAKLSKR
jgi:hypothetical protein